MTTGLQNYYTSEAEPIQLEVIITLRNVSRIVRQLMGVLTMVMLVGGCGAARKSGETVNDPTRYSYDEKLQLRLEEIISGKLGAVNLQDPVSVEINANGGLIILEQTPPRIIALDSNRQVIREVGGSDLATGGLSRPRFVRSGLGLTFNVADESGWVLVYDSRLRPVSSFEPAYEASGYPGGSPSGVAVTAFGDTYLADQENEVVYLFDPSGKFVENIGGDDAGAGRLTRPEGLTVAEDGALIVCDTDAQRVVVFNQDGEYFSSIGDGELTAPVSVALTPDDQSIFIGGRQGGRLDLYSLGGEQLASWEGVELTPGGVGRIMDLLVDDMCLYLVDAENKQILKFRLVPSRE